MKNDQIEKVFYRCYDAPDYSAKYLPPPPPLPPRFLVFRCACQTSIKLSLASLQSKKTSSF